MRYSKVGSNTPKQIWGSRRDYNPTYGDGLYVLKRQGRIDYNGGQQYHTGGKTYGGINGFEIGSTVYGSTLTGSRLTITGIILVDLQQ